MTATPGTASAIRRMAVTFGPILLRPQSRGTITLRLRDPKDKPIIDPPYLSDDTGADWTALLAGLRICARIAEAPATRRHRQDRAAAKSLRRWQGTV